MYLIFQKKKGSLEEEYYEDDLDLDKVIYTIGHYVKDREALLGELFHCVQGSSLQRNLPDVLKVRETGTLYVLYNVAEKYRSVCPSVEPSSHLPLFPKLIGDLSLVFCVSTFIELQVDCAILNLDNHQGGFVDICFGGHLMTFDLGII